MPEEADLAAMELALGVLEGEERSAAMRRRVADRSFAREVAYWQDRLALLLERIRPVTPPAGVLARVERSLTARNEENVRGRRSVRLWRALAAISTAAASLLLYLTVVDRAPDPAGQPLLVARMAGTPESRSVSAIYQPADGVLRVTRFDVPANDRSAELWVIPAGGTPQSLGLLTAGAQGSGRIRLDEAIRARLAAGATLAISIERQGGSSTGQPTGPIVAQGSLETI